MKPLAKYIKLLETDLELLRSQVAAARRDVEFYRGKVERLELSLMSLSMVPAQIEYARRSELPKEPPREIRPTQVPFMELKRRWMAMSAEEQEKAQTEGWVVDEKTKEETNAGS